MPRDCQRWKKLIQTRFLSYQTDSPETEGVPTGIRLCYSYPWDRSIIESQTERSFCDWSGLWLFLFLHENAIGISSKQWVPYKGPFITRSQESTVSTYPETLYSTPESCILFLNTYFWYIWYIFVNCNWVVTRWQKNSTHLHTDNT